MDFKAHFCLRGSKECGAQRLGCVPGLSKVPGDVWSERVVASQVWVEPARFCAALRDISRVGIWYRVSVAGVEPAASQGGSLIA